MIQHQEDQDHLTSQERSLPLIVRLYIQKINIAFPRPAALPEKKKVLFIMGATGTGKSKLSISLGNQFRAEIINSDKIQVYKGLDIITNKVPEQEQCGIPHHLLGIVEDPDSDFTANDFCHHTLAALDDITKRERLPIIVGGSNTYLEALVEGPNNAFHSKYDCCFIWLDVSLSVLFPYLYKRLDEMVDAGVVDEIRDAFVPGADYSRGIRRAIGVPELNQYFQVEGQLDEVDKEWLLKVAIQRMKENTCKLAEVQQAKIRRLKNEVGWELNRIDATQVFDAILRGEEYRYLWKEIVFEPSLKIVKRFLKSE